MTPTRQRVIDGETQSEVAKKSDVKRSYTPPRLLEYGNIAKLTQSGTVSGNDFIMMQACL
ncbi:MAG: lasso RiPP family leader peptide-containing protein [Deltaproteobacteria bacterium]|nr:lasso RiPP family leader peptide-containing protein [Deltaproteobacteria bacterium]